MSVKLLVLGLDAACWPLVDRLAGLGWLPTIQALATRGWRAPLASTNPPITPPAWTTIITGVQPARHGVLSFCRPDPGSGLVQPTNGLARQVRTIFDYLGEEGVTSGAVNIPWTYPAGEWPGFCVSGFDAPSLDAAAFSSPELAAQLRTAAPDYALHVSGAGPVEAIVGQTGHKVVAALALARSLPVDVLFVVLMATDVAGHVHWPDTGDELLPDSPLVQVYRAADRALAQLLDAVTPRNVVVLSDHGMGRCHALLNFSQPLFAAGLMRPAAGTWQRLTLPLYRGARAVFRRLRGAHAPGGDNGGGAHVNRWAPRVDWQRSAVHSGHGFGWLQLQGEAVAKDETRAREVLLAAAADRYPAPILGVERADGVEGGPKLLVRVNYEAGYWMAPPILDPAEPFLIRDTHHPAFQRAGHRPHGLFVAAGSDVGAGEGDQPIAIQDVAPTLIHLAGGTAPEGLDGHTDRRLLAREALAARPPATRWTPLERERGETSYSDEQRQAVEGRLRDLGYM